MSIRRSDDSHLHEARTGVIQGGDVPRAHDVPLFTRNAKDFEPLSDLVDIRSA